MNKDFKVALIMDSMITPGGAEKLMMSLIDIYPNAQVFTTIFIKENFWDIPVQINECIRIPKLFKKLFKIKIISIYISSILSIFSPIYIETINLKEFDLIISLSARVSKGVISRPDSLFIDYVQTPTRFEWDNEQSPRAFRMRYINKLLSDFVSTIYRIWDYSASKRSDYKVAISNFIKEKIKKYYRLESKVIYPGISNFYYQQTNINEERNIEKELHEKIKININQEKYYLVVSRLYDYKRNDWAVKACKEANKNLIIVGDGPDKKFLMKCAGNNLNKLIYFTGRISDNAVRYLYSKAEALIFAGVEDFGMVPVEAMAQGCPVLAYNEGGGAETILDNVTGTLFNTYHELTEMLSNYHKPDYNSEQIVKRAETFHEDRFKKDWCEFVKKIAYEKKS